MTRSPRNRVLGDRLWDEDGREWCCSSGEWVDAAEVERQLAGAERVVLHGFHRPMRWLTVAEAAGRWREIRSHLEVPGLHGADCDAEGLTYAATVWRRGDRRILGFEAFC